MSETPSAQTAPEPAVVLPRIEIPSTGRPAERYAHSLLGGIQQLATARAIAIVISFATAPIIARFYPPQAYGILGVFTTLLSVLAAFASVSYVSAVPLAATAAERRDLFVLCSLIGGATTLMVTGGIFLGANSLAAGFHEPDLVKYVPFFPLLFLGNAIRQLLDTTLSCQRRFGTVALRNALEMVVGRAVQFGACFVGLLGSPAGLITGSLAGSYVSALAAGVGSIRKVTRTAGEPLNLAGLRSVAVKYRKFPLIVLWSGTINALTLGLPAMILGFRFSVEIVGLYGMAYTMVTLPLQLFTASANQVFYVEVADRVARGESAVPTTQQLVRVLSVLTSFPLAVVLVLGPLLFTTFLGTKWHEAGILGQILVPWMALAAISSTLGVAYQVFNRQGEGFIWNIILLVVRFCALYFGGLFFGPRGTLGLFVAASAAVVAWLIVRPLSLLSVSRRWSAATIARGYVEPLLLLVPAGVAYWCFDAQLISLAALAGATFVHALLLCRRYPKILRPLLSRLPARWATSLRFN